MKIPGFLPQGGTIGITAPSFGCVMEPYASAFGNALRNFQDMGYRVRTTPDCFMDDGIGISTDPKECASEFMSLYADNDVDFIISAGGGELMCETLGYIDFDRLADAKPKFFAGYSDNTNLTFTMPTILDTAAIYCPCAPSFGMKPWHPSLTQDMELFTGARSEVSGFPDYEKVSLKTEENPLAPYNCTEKKVLTLFEGGSKKREAGMRGRLLGGCLDILTILCGTKYDKVREFNERYKNDGIIWFLEACDLNVLDIRRTFWQLRKAGWFERAAGFIIGRPLSGEPVMGLDAHGAVLGEIEDLGLPVILDADLGHLPPVVPIVSGAFAEVHADADNIRIRYDFSR
ncbi:MAG: S66 family peptidase [Lachnospiraceae bacterium]|jgi:muramoyltetrapeptide carboxypeptidase